MAFWWHWWHEEQFDSSSEGHSTKPVPKFFEGWTRHWLRCIASQGGVLWRWSQWYEYLAVKYVALLLQWICELSCQTTYTCIIMECCQSGGDWKLWWKARFCEMSEPHSEEGDNSEVSRCIWGDIQSQTNVAFISEETVEADNSLLLCAAQELDDLCFEDNSTETC
jgi:hypothetical protein